MVSTFAAGGKFSSTSQPVLIVGYSYGYFDARDMFRMDYRRRWSNRSS